MQTSHPHENTHTPTFTKRKRGKNDSHVEAEFQRRLGNNNKIKVNCSRPTIFYVIILQIAEHRAKG